MEGVNEFVFNFPPTPYVIWRWGKGLVLSDRLEEPGIKFWTLGTRLIPYGTRVLPNGTNKFVLTDDSSSQI